MTTTYSDALSHYCYNCRKDNFSDDDMHKVDHWHFTRKNDPTTYQLYVCSDCWKIAHFCCVCGKLFFDAHPNSGPGDIFRHPECYSCSEREWEDF